MKKFKVIVSEHQEVRVTVGSTVFHTRPCMVNKYFYLQTMYMYKFLFLYLF